eukprot:TRINITY_DN7949_c0_g1_i1.p1 TRINITY_DN7949_c0_g1~~TRINITY_DN7949_c0_g1_i1.p1  ORF type:complete len:299 (+),score=79.71 TRINITY_DN7949_c0_g1_i1:41-898(+)
MKLAAAALLAGVVVVCAASGVPLLAGQAYNEKTKGTSVVVVDTRTGASRVVATVPQWYPRGGVVDRNNGVYYMISNSLPRNMRTYNLTDGTMINAYTDITPFDCPVFDVATSTIYASDMPLGYAQLCHVTGANCKFDMIVKGVEGYTYTGYAWNEVDRQYIHLFSYGASGDVQYVYSDLVSKQVVQTVSAKSGAVNLAYDNVNGRLCCELDGYFSTIDAAGEVTHMCPVPVSATGGLIISDDASTVYVSGVQQDGSGLVAAIELDSCKVLFKTILTDPLNFVGHL